MKGIEFLSEALKEFKALTSQCKKDQREVTSAPDTLHIKPLKEEFKNKYRLRVGSYRVIYQKENKKLLILIVRIRHRKEVHR